MIDWCAVRSVVLSEHQFKIFENDFNQYDKDGTGFLEDQELVALLTDQLGAEPDDAQREVMLEALDRNKDGLVSLDEYVDWVSCCCCCCSRRRLLLLLLLLWPPAVAAAAAVVGDSSLFAVCVYDSVARYVGLIGQSTVRPLVSRLATCHTSSKLSLSRKHGKLRVLSQ